MRAWELAYPESDGRVVILKSNCGDGANSEDYSHGDDEDIACGSREYWGHMIKSW
jgi:hypothetical protein